MRTSVKSLLKSGFSQYASLLMGKQVDEAIKRNVIETEEFARQKAAHFPNPQRRPINVLGNGNCLRAMTPVIEANHEPHMKDGKPVHRKAYVLSNPKDPDSVKVLREIPSVIHRGMDRKALKKALYNDRRLAAGRWVN